MSDLAELLLLVEHNCAECGIRFGIPAILDERRKDDYRNFWCPNGHCVAYRKPPRERDEELDDLRKQVGTMRVERDEARDELATERAFTDQLQSKRRPLLRWRHR